MLCCRLNYTELKRSVLEIISRLISNENDHQLQLCNHTAIILNEHLLFLIGWSQQRNVKPSSNISMENTSRLHLEFQVRFLFLITFWDDISFKRSILKVFPNNTFQCRQSLCCVNLLMEARRSDRAKGNICRTAGPGREMGTR